LVDGTEGMVRTSTRTSRGVKNIRNKIAIHKAMAPMRQICRYFRNAKAGSILDRNMLI
jgi:hypothetical protein